MAISSPEMMLVPAYQIIISHAPPSSSLSCQRMRTEVDVTEGAGADLAADAVLVADPEILCRRVSVLS